VACLHTACATSVALASHNRGSVGLYSSQKNPIPPTGTCVLASV
jgi:hypothetical protein